MCQSIGFCKQIVKDEKRLLLLLNHLQQTQSRKTIIDTKETTMNLLWLKTFTWKCDQQSMLSFIHLLVLHLQFELLRFALAHRTESQSALKPEHKQKKISNVIVDENNSHSFWHGLYYCVCVIVDQKNVIHSNPNLLDILLLELSIESWYFRLYLNLFSSRPTSSTNLQLKKEDDSCLKTFSKENWC